MNWQSVNAMVDYIFVGFFVVKVQNLWNTIIRQILTGLKFH